MFVALFDGIKVDLSIDIATGDVIIPQEIEYDYKMLFEDRTITLMTYTIETIIAEKYQTVLDRGILNSRMKNYYDLYYLLINSSYDSNILKEAINRTFEKRHTDLLFCKSNIYRNRKERLFERCVGQLF